MLNEYGTLTVRVAVAGNALPVEGAIVRIRGAEEANSQIAYSLQTDVDGVTEPVSLPAPRREYSMSPSPAQPPYAVYDIEITADGYYSKRIYGVSVFPGINSLQVINMIPRGDAPILDYPRGNINSNIPENYM